jgi:hypothetical protein
MVKVSFPECMHVGKLTAARASVAGLQGHPEFTDKCAHAHALMQAVPVRPCRC